MNRIIYTVFLLFVLSQVSFGALNNKQISPLEKDIKIYHTNDNGIPTFVAGNLKDKVAKSNELAAVYEFFETNKSIYKILSPIDELQLLKIETDELGMTHLKLQQQYNGLDVIGSDISAHFRNDGMFTAVNGQYTPIKEMNTTPQIISSDALVRAQDDLRIDFGEGTPTEVELVIFPWQKETFLCWRFFILSNSPMGRWEYFINAENSDIVFKANRIMNVEAVGTGTGVMGNVYNHIDTWDNGSDFDMIDYTRRANNNIHGHNGQLASNAIIRTYLATTSLPGTVASDADNSWGGTTYAPAVDGHMYSTLFYDWVLRDFGRNSYNNNGASMNISVNYSAEGNNNAYWNGAQIVVWSWSSGWRSLAGCPDVIAHEWGHAITGSTSGLIYQHESGALNESFSDMIGAAFEFAHDTLDTPDWLMGENGIIGGTGFRNMENPHVKNDPDFYGTSDPYWVDVVGCTPTNANDWCGVHTNSGVGNKWFSLLSDGGVHTGITVTGLSVDTAIAIAFRANTVYWNTGTTYAEAAAGTILAANDLDPSGNWEAEVINAWTAVGVSLPAPTLVFSYPSGTPTTLTPNVDETFDVTIAGIFGGELVDNSGQIYISINSGSYQSSAMTQTSPSNYQATLPGVACGDVVDYYFSADLVSPASTIFDGSPTNHFTAVPFTNSLTVFQDDFESDLGWIISGGAWARGVPTGGGGEYGGVDPTSGTVGSNVFGYNLNGDYANSIPEYHISSPAIDCSNLSSVRIKFDRWLGVEQPAYDHAYVRISTDNNNWTTVWENDVEIADIAWTAIDLDISAVAALESTVYIRFTMGTSDGGWRFCGWNIDNLKITGTECTTSSNIVIVTTSLPDWTANFSYSEQLTAIDGAGTLNWSDKNNDLVSTGLTLSTSGLLSGSVSTNQTISFTALVIDNNGSDEKLFSFNINPIIVISNTSLDDWTEGLFLSHQFSATGGTGSLIFTDKNNDLVSSGLSLSAIGELSGVPTSGTYNFVCLVTDSLGATTEEPLSIHINDSLLAVTTSLTDWTVSLAYAQQMLRSGGTGAVTFIDKNNDLNGSGLSLSITGLLNGTVVSEGLYTFTMLISDAISAVTEQELSINVNPPVTITTLTLPDSDSDTDYTHQLNSTGGTGITTWVDKNNELPIYGLILQSDGLVSGFSNVIDSITFTAVATDEVGYTAELTYTFEIQMGYFCGDVNSSGLIDVSDLVELVAFMFSSGPPPGILGAADVDGSGSVDVSDLVTLVAYMFSGAGIETLVCGVVIN